MKCLAVPVLVALFLAALVFCAGELTTGSGTIAPIEFPAPTIQDMINQTPFLRISHNADLIVVYYRYGPDLFVYDKNGSLLWNRTIDAEQMPWVSSASIAPDGKTLLVTQIVPGCCHGVITNTSLNKVVLFATNGSRLWEYPTYNPPMASAFLGSSGESIIGMEDGRILILTSSGTLKTLTRLEGPVTFLAASRDGSMIVAAGNFSNFRDLAVFNSSGTQLWDYRTGGRNTAAMSNNGSVIAVHTGWPSEELLIFNRSGNLVARRSPGGISTGCSVTGDGSRIVAGNQGSVLVFGNNGSLLQSYSMDDEILSISGSVMDDRVIITTNRSVRQLRPGTIPENYGDTTKAPLATTAPVSHATHPAPVWGGTAVIACILITGISVLTRRR